MKSLRCIVAIALCLLVFLTISPAQVSAEEFTAASAAKLTEVPAELKEYAAESILPFIKGWLKSSGKVGKHFESAEEIDQLQVGAIFKIGQIKGDTDYNKITVLSDAIYVPGDWMMLACTPEGEAKWYALITDKTDEGKGYGFAREGSATALGQALEVFETINRENGLSATPTVIWYNPYEMFVMESVDGMEYVVTAVTGESLDRSFKGVTDLKYLPTGMDAVEALREVSSRPTTNENGDFLLGDARLIRLTASEQPSIWKSPAVWIAVTGICAVSACAACLVVRRKRKAEMAD